MRQPGSGQTPEQSRRHQRQAVVGAADTRRRLRWAVLLPALISAVFAATAVLAPAPDPLGPPDAWADDSMFSWAPVADATSYVVVSSLGGRTTQRVVPCCSMKLPGIEATASHFVRVNRAGGRWAQAGRRYGGH